MITGCVTASGMLDDDITANVLEDALRQGGVTVFDATGQRLDPDRHHVDHTSPAPDPNSDDIIADTITPGYLDNNRVLRPAQVVVYRWAQR